MRREIRRPPRFPTTCRLKCTCLAAAQTIPSAGFTMEAETQQAEGWEASLLQTAAAALEQGAALQTLAVKHVDAPEDWIGWIRV